jgi:hypothetical protein
MSRFALRFLHRACSPGPTSAFGHPESFGRPEQATLDGRSANSCMVAADGSLLNEEGTFFGSPRSGIKSNVKWISADGRRRNES